CVALALYRNPEDPRSFDETALQDDAILNICKKIVLVGTPNLPSPWSSQIALQLLDGRTFEIQAEYFHGMPFDPLSGDALRDRFLSLTGGSVASETANT